MVYIVAYWLIIITIFYQFESTKVNSILPKWQEIRSIQFPGRCIHQFYERLRSIPRPETGKTPVILVWLMGKSTGTPWILPSKMFPVNFPINQYLETFAEPKLRTSVLRQHCSCVVTSSIRVLPWHRRSQHSNLHHASPRNSWNIYKVIEKSVQTSIQKSILRNVSQLKPNLSLQDMDRKKKSSHQLRKDTLGP